MSTNECTSSTFANWLDAFVAGKSTPGQRDATDSGTFELSDAASQIHDLAGQTSRTPIDQSFPATWEDFMQARLSSETVRPFPIPAALPSGPVSISRPGRDRGWVNLDRIAGVLVAAVLLIALSAGIWRVSGGGDGPPPEPTSELAALVQGTPDSAGTPSAVESVDLPTAEDCTVEPLTVDEVLWYVTDPASALTNVPEPGKTLEELQTLEWESKLQEAFADVTQEEMMPSLASAEDIEAASETQRMWMACVLAESYFQVWALESPYLVQSDVINRLPPLTGVEETRAILEDLKEIGAPVDVESTAGFQLFSAMGFPGSGGIQLISPDTGNSWKMDVFSMALGFDRFEADGTYVSTSNIFKYPTTKTVFDFGGGSLSCDGYRFDWSHAREMWLVAWAPTCG
jgi:hypothetical protein